MTTHLRFGVSLAVVCFAGMSARPAVGQDVALRYRWTKGEEFRYRTSQQISTTVSGAAVPRAFTETSTDQTINQVILTIVDDVAADGTATLRQVIESVRVEMNNPAGRLVFDSTTSNDNAGNPMGQMLSGMYSAMIGQPVTVVTSPTGAVQKIDGMSRLMENMLKNLTLNPPAAAGLLDNLKNTFSDNTMQDLSARGLSQFPDRPLKPGDSWDNRFTVGAAIIGTITTSKTSTFEGVENRGGSAVARITSKLTMKSDPAAPLSLGSFTMQMGESTGDGELIFDVAKGRLQRVKTVVSQVMTLSGMATPDGSSMSMTTQTKSTMTLELQ